VDDDAARVLERGIAGQRLFFLSQGVCCQSAKTGCGRGARAAQKQLTASNIDGAIHDWLLLLNYRKGFLVVDSELSLLVHRIARAELIRDGVCWENNIIYCCGRVN
jgi:hypothetical protein